MKRGKMGVLKHKSSSKTNLMIILVLLAPILFAINSYQVNACSFACTFCLCLCCGPPNDYAPKGSFDADCNNIAGWACDEDKYGDSLNVRFSVYENTGGSGGGGNSFVSGTPVMLADGSSKAIEEIIIGDEVRSFNPETSAFAIGKVTFTLKRDVQESYVIGFDDGSSVGVTGTHPFYVKTAAAGVPTIT